MLTSGGCVALVLLQIVYKVDLLPTFKIATIIQDGAWPAISPEALLSDEVWPGLHSEALNNDAVQLDVMNATFSDGTMELTRKVCKLVDEDVDGFILFVDCKTANILDKQMILRYIPSVVVIRGFCHVTSTSMIQLRQDCSNSNTLLADIAVNRQWRNVLLYHDRTYNSACITDLIRQLSLKPVSTRMVQTENYHGPEQYIKFVSKYKPDGICVITSSGRLEKILFQAKTEEVLHFPWILLSEDQRIVDLNGSEYSDGNIILLEKQSTGPGLETCEHDYPPEMEFKNYLADAKLKMLDLFSTTVTKNNITSLEPLSCFNHKHTSMFNRTVIMKTAEEGSHITDSKYQICSVENGLINKWKYMGSWSEKTGISMKQFKLFGNDFLDFGNATLKVAAVPLDPMVFFNTDENNKTTYTGLCIDILDQLALKLNFNYEIVTPADNAYGSLEDDGTWNGMVGMVMRKEADFAAGPFTITAARESVIDFTKTYMEEGVGILTLRPQVEANKEYKMFKPLSVTVWILIGVAIIVVGVVMFIVNRYSPCSTELEEHQHYLETENLSSSMWLIYGAFVEQGGDAQPRSLSGRVMLSFWWIFTILMAATYTANLAAYLTVTIIDSPINSLEELARHENIRPLIFTGANLHTLFQTAKTSVYRQIWSKMDDMPKANHLETILSYVRTNEYALLLDHSVLEYIMLQDCKTYAVADETFNKAGYGFVLPEHSNYLNAFNIAIMKMTEAGLIQKWREIWWPKSESDSCTSTDRSGSAQSLGLDSLYGLFYVYFGVVGIAVLSFIVELICSTKTCRQYIAVALVKLSSFRGKVDDRNRENTSKEES
ncbi:glutamate receptor-like isoform X1 [Mytilus galloprovincialis]|uniref:glutamate receptor-like isoform X1 n=1 Tax=Mytilus galloprovincialis TaxID=29158 RepID=UPI003F7B4B9B